VGDKVWLAADFETDVADGLLVWEKRLFVVIANFFFPTFQDA
jgi:hypothetical protein